MPALSWKTSTFVALGAAAFFAVHPIRSAPNSGTWNAADRAANASTTFLTSWVPFATATSESPTGKLTTKLRAARTTTAACEALSALGYLGDDEATAAVAEATDKTRRAEVRVCAVEALGKMKTGAARSWLVELIEDRDGDVRDAALEALAASEDPSARGVVLGAAHSDDPALRLAALLALGNAHVAEGTPLLIGALSSADLETRVALVEALGASGDSRAVEPLSRMVSQSGPRLREAAIEALGNIGGAAAITVLEGVMLEGRRDSLPWVANALASMVDPNARRALLAVADGESHEAVTAAMGALKAVDGDDVRDLMLRELEASDPSIAAAAAKYFGARHDDRAVPALVEMASHGSKKASAGALSALGTLGGAAAHAAVLELATHAGDAQLAALTELGKMPGGRDEARALCVTMVRESSGPSPAGPERLFDDGRSGGRARASRGLREQGQGDPPCRGGLARAAEVAVGERQVGRARRRRRSSRRPDRALGPRAPRSPPRRGSGAAADEARRHEHASPRARAHDSAGA